jgi:hypothetical protein
MHLQHQKKTEMRSTVVSRHLSLFSMVMRQNERVATSTIMEVATVAVAVPRERRPVVRGGGNKRVAEKVISPRQILIFLTHAHQSKQRSPRKRRPTKAD